MQALPIFYTLIIIMLLLSSCTSYHYTVGAATEVAAITVRDTSECISKGFDDCVFPEQNGETNDAPEGVTSEELEELTKKRQSKSQE